MKINFIYITIFILITSFFQTISYSQKLSKEDQKKRKKAEALVRSGKINEARGIYQELTSKSDVSDAVLYGLGNLVENYSHSDAKVALINWLRDHNQSNPVVTDLLEEYAFLRV